MTEEIIYRLAWRQQLMVWSKESEILARMPENEITKIKEQKAYEALIEIENLMKEKGYK